MESRVSRIVGRYGLWGIFVLSFGSATLLPGVSEAGLVAVALTLQFKIGRLVGVATLGNWLGGMLTYATGWWLGIEQVAEWFSISPESIAEMENWVDRYGGWAGLGVWLPIVGDPLAAALGVVRANPMLVGVTMLVGKAIRYVVIAWPAIKAGEMIEKKRDERQEI
ncbi:MAG: DedA family protein [Bacteroidales bacterium]|nr:DedA family protein [Bacteroidales bacterium]